MNTFKLLIVVASAAAALVVGLSAQSADHRAPPSGAIQDFTAN